MKINEMRSLFNAGGVDVVVVVVAAPHIQTLKMEGIPKKHFRDKHSDGQPMERHSAQAEA